MFRRRGSARPREIEKRAVVGEAGVELRGMDNGHGGDVHGVYLVKNALEDKSQVSLAEGEEAAGVRMAIDGAAAGKIVFTADFLWTVPIHEVVLDGFAVGV